MKLKTELDYGVLDIFSGKSVKESCVSFGPDISNKTDKTNLYPGFGPSVLWNVLR